MTLKEQLNEDVKEAMRSGDKEKRDTLRLLQAAIKQEEIDGQTTLDDAGVQAVLTRQAKQRRESIADYEKAGRSELAEEERRQLVIIESYLPQMMSREEIESLAAQAIAEVNASDVKDMGKVMGRLMPQLKGKADGRLVNEVVRGLLSH
ncbi:MAG TPA: GatB/YqeY domain-containing protein [Anaerolineae bacterium]|nr:GatB/YqeY domain-containing protein [Anaerolineae bacterium]HIP71878.1 GatB/YqeY domain-containing protein [Anaerolineae bacterium]